MTTQIRIRWIGDPNAGPLHATVDGQIAGTPTRQTSGQWTTTPDTLKRYPGPYGIGPHALSTWRAKLAGIIRARIEATAYRPRPRGRGMESPATAKARADVEIALIRTMRDTLARVSEAAAFTWQQTERRPDGSATITFRRPKTDADTTAYLAPITVAALDAIRRGAADTAPLFGLSDGQIKRRIQAAAKAAGLEGVSNHGCRIGTAQDLARSKGIEMPAIMQAGGWRSETTVARYTARESAARGAVARFYEQEAEQ